MNATKIEVYIADDHTMFTAGLVDVVNRGEKVNISRTFGTIAACKQALALHRPAVLLLDISMSDGNGSDFCKWLLAEYPDLKILAITSHDEYSIIRRMLESGAHGYLLKTSSIDELTDAVETIVQGESYISREVEKIIKQGKANEIIISAIEKNILRHICDGRTNPEIANALNLSTETVNWYRKRLLAKFGANNTATLVATIIKNNVLE